MRSTMSGTLNSLFFLAVIAACSSSPTPVSSTPPVSQRKDTTVRETRSNFWTPQVRPGRWHYLIQDSSTVSISSDTNAQSRPIKSTTVYSISIDDSMTSLVLTGRVDSLFVDAPSPKTKVKTDTTRKPEFHVRLSKQSRLEITNDQKAPTCVGATNSPASRIGELVITLPLTPTQIGDKWADTLIVSSCHGKIPLIQTAMREYELVNPSSCQQQDAVEVRRTVSTTIAGASAESNSHLSANGSGTGSAILCVNRGTGTLLGSTGQSRLDLTVVTSRGTFPFTQITNTQIELR